MYKYSIWPKFILSKVNKIQIEDFNSQNKNGHESHSYFVERFDKNKSPTIFQLPAELFSSQTKHMIRYQHTFIYNTHTFSNIKSYLNVIDVF